MKGFEDIVDTVRFEGFKEVVFVGGAEDHGAIDGDLLKNVEAVAVGELDVHEEEVDAVGSVLEKLDGAFDAVADIEDGMGVVEREDEFL